MGLNVKDIQVRLFRAVQVSAESSYTFLQKHPLVSGVLLVCFILYVFLSYIYSFLVYVSPFLVCGAIFLKIFWSSEQTQLRYVKTKEEKGEQKIEKVEPKYPKIPNNGRRELLYKYPSQNAISRRRNFRDKKWDVYGGLGEKAKDLSAVFQNEFTKRNTESLEKGESSLDHGLSGRKIQAPKRQTLRSEPSMVDLVECVDAEAEAEAEKIEDGEDEDEEDAQEDRNKAIEWTEDDQKNLMDLGISEMERNKRLESLIARRRERKLLKLRLENGLIDKKPITMTPLLITRGNPLDSSKDFEGVDGLEMPGSAPSRVPRSPYDIPYDPSEEKPNLTGDSFLEEHTSHQKDMPFCRHESFSLGPHFSLATKQDQGAREPYSFNGRRYSNRLAYSRFRKLPDKGNHDWLIDQLIYSEGGENGSQEPNLLRMGEETTHEEDGKCKTDVADMEVEKVETAHETKSMPDQTCEPDLIIPNISNVETDRVSERPRPGPRFSKPHERLLHLPVPATNTSTSTTATINESVYDHVPSPVDKRHESMFLTDRRICHTPTYSIASDLQVEVSEVGSLASTVDENAETNSSIDRDSVVYDGDIDRDVSSGSEDLWGASFHGREPRGVRSEEDIAEEENKISKEIVTTPLALRQIEEENAADVSSMSSRSDMPEDTPTCAINTDQNIFGYMKYSVGETEVPQSFDQLPNGTHSEKPEELCNLSENLTNELQVINDVNSSAATEQDNAENSMSNEDPGPSTSVVRQESIDEASIYSVSSSPRSVLPDKTIADEVSSSAYNQQMDIDAQQSNIEDMAQETLNGELPPDTMPQNIQPLMDDITDESHNVDFNHSQEQTNPPENSIEESNIFGNMKDGEVCTKEEQGKLNNEENSGDNNTHQISQEGTSESTRQINEMTTMENRDEKSRDLVDDKVPSTELVEDDKNEIPASGNIHDHEDLMQPRVTEPMVPGKEANEGHAEDS